MRHTLACALILASTFTTGIHACATPTQAAARSKTVPGDVDATVRDLCMRYAADRDAIHRFYDVRGSNERDERSKLYDVQVLAELDALDFDALGVEGRVDWTLLHRHILSAQRQLEIDRAKTAEIAALVPFADAIAKLRDAQRHLEPGDPETIANTLESIRKDVEKARKDAESSKDKWTKPLARRGARRIEDLKNVVDDWYRFRADYDPAFTWWTKKPFEALDHALDDHLKYVRETLGGDKPDADKSRPIVGDPIGREALLAELDAAMIPATPEDLIAIADREMQWCTQQMIESSRALGSGDDWKAALEKVKQDHVAPGEQPKLVADLAHDAVAFLEKRELVTVPPLCAETWRITMLSPDDQRESPFFLGGEDIQVAFPTDTMTNDEKRMSMRGNNRHFAHATVFHELIPGHCLQAWYESRSNVHRRIFSTPFYTEGWALYWEMLMWDKGYDATPEDKIGALFWRMHRCARIKFSLGFHLGQMTPEQCVDYLVDAVGHERKNAEAEVRRSFEGGYGPLYQCAYMIGGQQLRALHHDVVDGGKMSDRAFHDAVLEGANMPIEMVRARVLGTKLAKDWKPGWRFWETK
jgi:uncharacterized protein (DUF885 family)